MRQGNGAGFSLLGFLVALLALATTSLMSASLYYKIANNFRASSYANELVAALTYARIQALTHSQTVSVCSSNNGRQCTDTPWGQGFIVFIDRNAKGSVDEGDQVLKRWSISSSSVTITLQGDRYISFGQMGNLVAMAQPMLNTVRAPSETVVHWMTSLSPISLAHADDEGARREPDRAVNSVSTPGAFTVCAGRTGRIVKISMLGQIKTDETRCY